MTTAIIRVLYGNTDVWPKIKYEVKAALSYEWAKKEVYHFAIGQANYDLLKSHGAERVELVLPNGWTDTSINSIVIDDRTTHFYNKTYLIRYAMEKFNEILFIDFDAFPCRGKKPDNEMWRILRSKKGRFNGSFQAPNVGYVRSCCVVKRNGGVRIAKDDTRKMLNTSVVYCSDKTWIDDHLNAYETFRKVARGGNTSWYNDEHILMYCLDMKYGVMSVPEMVDNFEPDIILLSRGVKEARLAKKQEFLYFQHA